jgi:hypothetical protein
MPNRLRSLLRLEPLEARDVPSGNVTASLSRVGPRQYRLSLAGDEYANDVVIAQAVVTGRNGTTVNGAAAYDLAPLLGPYDRITGVKADLGDGNDVFEVAAYDPTQASVGGDLRVAMGDGSDAVRLTVGTNVRNVRVAHTGGPADRDLTTVDATVGNGISGGVTVSNQAGTHETTLTGTIARSAVFTGVGGGDINNDTFVNGRATLTSTAAIGGSLTARYTYILGTGFPTINLSGSVGGDVVLGNPGNSGAKMRLTDLSVGRNVRIQTGSIGMIGDYCRVVLENSRVAGSVSVKGGIGSESLALSNTKVGGNVTFGAVIGDAQFIVSSGTSIQGSLTYSVGDTFEPFFLCRAITDSVFIRKSVSISFGRNSTYYVDVHNIGGHGVQILGNLTVRTKDNTYPTYNGGKVRLFGASVAGSVRVTNGAGRDTVLIDQTDIGGNLSVNTGTGVDAVAFGTNTDYPGVTNVQGNLLVNLGRNVVDETTRDVLQVAAQPAADLLSLRVYGKVAGDCVKPGVAPGGGYLSFYDIATGSAERVGYPSFLPE